jgi:hypothetical protein
VPFGCFPQGLEQRELVGGIERLGGRHGTTGVA